jgi:hypothetical protein
MSRRNPSELEVLRAVVGFFIIEHVLYFGIKIIMWLLK